MSHLAAIQMISSADVAANLQTAARLIAEAAEQGAQLILLPECFAAFGNSSLQQLADDEFAGRGPIRPFLAAQARQHGVWLVAGSMPLPARAGGKAMACCLVVDDQGRELVRYDKLHLFDVQVADRQRSYRESKDYGYGNQVVCVDTPVGRLGLSICYDVRFAELYLALRRAGAELIVVPSAFTAVTGAAHWEVLLRARAIETQCYVLAANQGGEHPNGRQTFGHSCLIDPWGELVACLPQGEGIISGQLDRQLLNTIRARMPIAEHRRFAPSDTIVPATTESRVYE